MAHANTSSDALSAAAGSVPQIIRDLPKTTPKNEDEADDYMNKTIDASETHIREALRVHDNSGLPHITTNQRKQVKELAQARAKNPTKQMKQMQALMGQRDTDKEPEVKLVQGAGITQPKELETDFKGTQLSSEITSTKDLPQDWTVGPVDDIKQLCEFIQTHYWVKWPEKYWEYIKSTSSYLDLGLYYKGELSGYAGCFVWNLEWTASRRQNKYAGFNWWIIAKPYRKRNFARIFLMHFLAQLQTEHNLHMGYTLLNQKPTQPSAFMYQWFFRPLQAEFLIKQNWWIVHQNYPKRARLFYKVLKSDPKYVVHRGAGVDDMQRFATMRLSAKKKPQTEARYNTLFPRNKKQWKEYEQIFDVLRVEFDGEIVALVGILPFIRRQDESKGWANTILVSWMYTYVNQKEAAKQVNYDIDEIVNVLHLFWSEQGCQFYNKVAGVFWPTIGQFAVQGGQRSLEHNRAHMFDQQTPNYLAYWNVGLYAHPTAFHSPLWMQS